MRFSIALLVVVISVSALHGQDFQLVGATTGQRATARVENRSLTVVQAGQTSIYRRDPTHDAVGYAAYTSQALQQIIRWPLSGSGPMQIGKATVLGVSWETSDMRVSPLGGIGGIGGPAPGIGLPGMGAVSPGAQAFDLLSPGRRDLALLSASSLTIQVGATSEVYARNAAYDDAGYLGYSNQTRVVRWPVAGGGKMIIGESAGGALQWRQSTMTISPRAGIGPGIVGPGIAPGGGAGAIDTRLPYQLTTALCQPLGLFLSVDALGNSEMSRVGQAWAIHAATGGAYQLSVTLSGRTLWLATNAQQAPILSASRLDAATYWTFSPAGSGSYRLESMQASHRGFSLDTSRNGAVRFLQTQNVPGQQWLLVPAVAGGLPAVAGGIPANPPLAGVLPGVGRVPRVISKEVVPNPALPPARVELLNGHTNELWVLVTDLRNPVALRRIRIPAGKSVTVPLDRDAGATLVETIQVRVGGVIQTQERITPQPPKRLYDISVYTLDLQSVARDIQGNIEETNYSPRSLGMIEVPAGDAMKDSRSDIYAAAKKRNNPGAVQRIDPRKWKGVPVGTAGERDAFDGN
ncbi:MAG: RICIN domain-containing protein [Planctomycetales bacterium]|nr:RICIN domain-containing protein [Planctomycetales bacterium]